MSIWTYFFQSIVCILLGELGKLKHLLPHGCYNQEAVLHWVLMGVDIQQTWVNSIESQSLHFFLYVKMRTYYILAIVVYRLIDHKAPTKSRHQDYLWLYPQGLVNNRSLINV